MHHLVLTLSKQTLVGAIAPIVVQAKEKYTENLDLYLKLILRRPLAKLLVRRLSFSLSFLLPLLLYVAP